MPSASVGQEKENGVVFVVFAHSDRRHDDNFMGVDEARLMSFCAADDDTVGAAFYDVEVQIRIFLCVGSQAAVAFGSVMAPSTVRSCVCTRFMKVMKLS